MTKTEVDPQEQIIRLKKIIQSYLWIDETTKRTMSVKNVNGIPWLCSKDRVTGKWKLIRNIVTTCQDKVRKDGQRTG